MSEKRPSLTAVPTEFLRALLHDSSCPWEPFAHEACGDPLHGESFSEYRADLLLALGKGSSTPPETTRAAPGPRGTTQQRNNGATQ